MGASTPPFIFADHAIREGKWGVRGPGSGIRDPGFRVPGSGVWDEEEEEKKEAERNQPIYKKKTPDRPLQRLLLE